MNRTKDIKDNRIAIIGLGYVGLPLAVEFGNLFTTIGYDEDENRINELKNSFDKTREISKDCIRNSVNLTFTSNNEKIRNCNIYIVTVPTPVDKFNSPDLTILLSVTRLVGSMLDKNDIVIYESTVFPGATEDLCVPILEKESNLKYNVEFFCGYSPERINPGDKKHSLKRIIKVTSGSNEKVSKFIDSLYKSIIPAGTHRVSSITVAEAAKVIENTQRDVNIALINEFSMIFNKLNLDTNEIINAANTKWNFIPFRPGLVGGHCIGVDPYYLTYKAILLGYHPEMILAGRKINDEMSNFISNVTFTKMIKLGINPTGAKIAVFGITFKKNCSDTRNSKVIDIIKTFKEKKCSVSVIDPYADVELVKSEYNIELKVFENLRGLDVIILAVDHDQYKDIKIESWIRMVNNKSIFIDVKSVYENNFFKKTRIEHWRL